MVVGQEVWEEWTDQSGGGGCCVGPGKGAKDGWEAKERAALRRNWLRSVERDQDYDRE